MKREYKFRAWDKKYNQRVLFDLEDLHHWTKVNNFHLDNYQNIQQYTGLKDKNGKEIYEGDIHGFKTKIDDKTTWCYLPVVFDNGAFWLDESFLKDRSMLTLLCEYKDEPLNIVANIYQDKHLLK